MYDYKNSKSEIRDQNSEIRDEGSFSMLPISFTKNDIQAKWMIGIFSFVVFAVVVSLRYIHVKVNLGFNVHLFSLFNAAVNSLVALLLLAALIAVRSGRYLWHKRMMLSALVLSVLFLVSYILHNIFAGETKFGGTGIIRPIYYIVLTTHIFLAAVILPFILFTAYRALIGEYATHKKLARITWPLWFYVAITGPLVYVMLRPYYYM